MIEDKLRQDFYDYLSGLDIYENKNSLKLAKIVVKPEYKNKGVGTKIMEALVKYADENKKIISLTPASDFGGNKNRLIQFYKKFGFKLNQGHHKSFEFRDAMIRYPKLSETKILIKKLLKEAIDKTIVCKKCGWSWKESESSKNDLYVCHECGHDNKPKTLNESLIKNNENDAKKIADFVNFTKKFLNIDDDVKVVLAFSRTSDLKTTAYYDLNGLVKVYVKDRALVDVMRSIAHELVHHKQNLEGRIKDTAKDGDDGSLIENEANSIAGVIIRKYGKLYPEIYE
jgi:N-acetylglutamate synthase-like GNAT family acetyltransferase